LTETEEQKAIVQWFRDTWPEYSHCVRVSMAGINLGGGRRASIMVNFMRSMGVMPDESDLLFAVPRGGYGSLVIEHKAADGKHPASDGQKDYLKRHHAIGNCAALTTGVDDAKEVITRYMAGQYAG
jgi:hypothetical protein